MFSIDDIKTLMKEMDQSSISELRVEDENGKVLLRKADAIASKHVQAIQAPAALSSGPAVTPPQPVAPVSKEQTANPSARDESLHQITSPMVGTFYAAPAPDADSYVKVGTKVEKKTVVCTLEAMKLFNEIEADCKGTIVDILAQDGQLVEYGQPLFLVKED
ncbi:MAG: acetyl-CoA carboxylase biotin carboxyl carrier protein [Sporolactobacillus sp.]